MTSETRVGSAEQTDTAVDGNALSPSKAAPLLMKVWTREGFTGTYSADQTAAYAPDFLSVEGTHAPRRAVLSKMRPKDEIDTESLPTLIASSKLGVRVLISGRQEIMQFVVRNVEADELHFIQHGRVKFETDMGVLTGEKNDFVCIPRGVGYRFGPIDRKAPMRSLIVECPSAYVFATPSGYSAGTINFDRHLELAKVEAASSPGGATRLILKLADGDKTTYVLPHDPLAMKAHLGGTVPVWKVNLGNIQQVTSLPVGGPPYPFLSSKAGELVMMNAGRRPNTGYRPPVHVNADYDEIMLYVDGPATWGGCTEPGTLTWVPKGVVHHGVAPFADQPFSSWLLETRATLKWTSEALAESELMETAAYGKHVAQR